ncbi:MAG: CHAD domain-containing protein [Candidatus Dormibacteria bacterium]
MSPVERCQVDLPVGTAFRLRQLRWGRTATTRIERFETIHWDTPDFRLAAWDAGLRYRRGRGWRVTLAGWPQTGCFRSISLDLEGGPVAPPPEALRLLSGYLGDAAPEPAARIRHLESRRDVEDLACVHQVVSLLVERRAVAHARRVSLRGGEELTGARRALAALRRVGVEETTVQPLLGELVGPAAAPRWRELQLDPTSTVAATVTAALRDYAARLVRNQALLLEGSDPEGIHQARVACRRFRSALQTFGPVLDPAWAETLRADLGSLAADLGAVRDAEVLLMRLRGSAAERGLEPEATERLLAHLDGDRVRAREVLLRRIGSPEHREQLERTLEAAAHPSLLPEAAVQPAVEVLMPLVAGSWRKLRRRASGLGAHPADDELHRLRILAKRCRYAVLALAPVLGEGPARTGALLGGLQDALGDQHDAVVAGDWLRQFATGETAFAAGILYGVERELAEVGREAWRGPWAKLLRRKQWGWA